MAGLTLPTAALYQLTQRKDEGLRQLPRYCCPRVYIFTAQTQATETSVPGIVMYTCEQLKCSQ